MHWNVLESVFESCCTTRNHRYVYGTAGFRDDATVLDTVMVTTGLLACLRSIALDGKAVGVMITASHNQPCDNGVKIVEPDGSMLDQSWEPFATELANKASFCHSTQEFKLYLQEKFAQYKVDSGITPVLVVGRDSRDSGPRLLQCLNSLAVPLMKPKIIDYGLLTTPQLHFLTNAINTTKSRAPVTEDDYYSFFMDAWVSITALHGIKVLQSPRLYIDAANGIGGPKVSKLFEVWPQAGQFTLVNNHWQTPTLLNNDCGADYVKTNQRLPKNIDPAADSDPATLYCSFDGDADRIVFYYQDAQNSFHLLDGDKISTLFALFISKQLKKAGLTEKISMGVVQTAYANGNSTNYLENVLNIPVSCAKTGVKHLHHEAITNYDVGIYFEANGHGTIMFSNKFFETCESLLKENNESLEVKTLLSFAHLINQTVGDAISDMLGVLAVLSIMKLTPSAWDKEYTDLPNLLTKVVVPDRSLFTTTDQERKLLTPEGAQTKIDAIVAKYKNGRSFVRASGTEDAVRVYAEASTPQDAAALNEEVSKAVLASV
ncbi:hypothetical protein TPHA_0M00210 [Tetrapisispora phaffii CBS 4417]|uniref:Phosphoacetylglucosamine mutase n=1 Tax=Tetrapisispora phaffii (strain ATCC 24235 / CBS 4417 / NBRC 1672 / NRRL Y-8282 / UCD 70-5) TaxID=1071381 RepID=G8C0T8_TETPH|nr:hypothetical protein TPHA_0M00210 [Tetrapisispora phaffii CBS 4417]CCE65599.1 hypothetical protein TPHA_0M00210 [Tetrapisispora phaffii CBS 4417]